MQCLRFRGGRPIRHSSEPERADRPTIALRGGWNEASDVVALTRRGFGASSQRKSGHGLARMSEDIDRVIEMVGVRPLHLIGHLIAGRRTPDCVLIEIRSRMS
jgi:pimeloyl-ACP methyl ester carboxylesterase